MTMQTEIPEDVMKAAEEMAMSIVGRMCMTMDHSFGLQSESEQRGLKLSMTQLAVHDIRPVIARAIMAERERDKWQPIKTAPKDGTHIILARFGDEYFEVAGGEWRLNPKAGEDGLNGFEAWISNPTHWMPIPTPPKQEA